MVSPWQHQILHISVCTEVVSYGTQRLGSDSRRILQGLPVGAPKPQAIIPFNLSF